MFRKTLILCCTLLQTFFAVAQGSLEKGINAIGKGLDDLAESYFREAVDTNIQARLQLGILLERQEHFSEATQWFIRADSSATAMTHLAACQAEQREWADAKRSAEKAIELVNPTDSVLRSSAMATLAWVYCIDENYTNALSWAHQAQAQDPTSARVLNVVGIIYFYKGNDNEATQTFRKAISTDPKNTDAYFNLGTMYCYRNNYDLAINTLKKDLK